MTHHDKIELSVDQLLETARRDTGINIVDADAAEPLQVLVRSFNEDGCLHSAGASALQTRMLRTLRNRLRMLRDFRDHPEIADQEVIRPLMISGSFRTGSTKLQQMLAASRDFNALPLWTSINFASLSGRPNEDVTSRIADAADYIAYNNRMSPDLDSAHKHDLFVADEETNMGLQSLRSSGYFGYTHVPTFLGWLGRQDPVLYFEFIRDALKYLQWQGLADASKRWLLKSPINLGMEEALTKAFPDAEIVVTHRPPAQTLASLLSLLEKLYLCHTDASIGDTHQFAAGQAMSLERHVQFRHDHPDFPVLDVHYKEATTNVDCVLKRVYDFAGERLSEHSFERMRRWDADNPIHKHGSHTYTLAQYGLTPDEITDLCPNYTRYYDAKFGQEKPT